MRGKGIGIYKNEKLKKMNVTSNYLKGILVLGE